MTQDDKPQGLMSAEALTSAQEDWDAYTYADGPLERGYGIALQARMLNRYPNLLAHIVAQDARIAYLVPVAGLAAEVMHSAGDFRDDGEWVGIDHGSLVQLRDYLLDDMDQYELVLKWLTDPAKEE